MVIHYYQQFFTGPEAPGTLTPRKLMRRLADAGHSVHVIATDFNAYNEQTEPPEVYGSKSGGQLTVHRLPSPRRFRRDLRSRLKTYLGFVLPAWRFGGRLPRPDVILGSIQPLFTGLVALRRARRCGTRFVLEIRDLWPDALEAKHAISRWQAWPLHRLAHHLYRSADRIVSLTPGIRDQLLRKGIRVPIDVLPNGYDPASFNLPPDTRDRVRTELGWGNQFVATFAGTHVEVTAVDTIVRAAAELRHRPEIRFELFGDGQRKESVVALARELGLDNIHFHRPVPKRRIPEILTATDGALMTLFKSSLIDIYFENKLVDYMGAGKAILAAMDGMQGRLIETHQTGRVVGSLDHRGLADLVAWGAEHPADIRRLGANGRRFASSRLQLSAILDRYSVLLESIAAGAGAQLPAWAPF